VCVVYDNVLARGTCQTDDPKVVQQLEKDRMASDDSTRTRSKGACNKRRG
jgi:hypothetical protein